MKHFAPVLVFFSPIVVALTCTAVALRPAQAVTIDTVPIGNAGNAGESQSLSGIVGGVAYNYRMGKYEVTIGQYTEFLNAVATTDTYGLYNTQMATNLNIVGIARGGSPGSYSYNVIGSANHPVTYVSWGDAARFANWLHNGQPTGLQDASTTEDGAYTLNGATTNPALNAVSRNAGATWFIPSGDEWYKAAYHKNDGATANYWDYPMSTDAEPYSDEPPGATPDNTRVGNFRKFDFVANTYLYAVTGAPYDPSVNYLTDVGAYALSPSPYGTFDQGGNVSEWTEAQYDPPGRGQIGGTWSGDYIFMASHSLYTNSPANEFSNTGFRVAAVPEPSTWLLLAVGGALFALSRARRRRERAIRSTTLRTSGSLFIVLSLSNVTATMAVTIDTVPVGNAGNAGEVQSQGTFGGVANIYRIGTYEVTVGQYTAFLNAVAATDTYALYNTELATSLNSAGIMRSGSPGTYSYSAIGSPSKPVTFVSWGDAARFANWLHNGQPAGPQGAGTTETGAYTLNGATTRAALNAVTRNAGATWFIPSENEWYKAAYHQPAAQGGDSDNYWAYPMKTNSLPYSDQAPGATPDNTQVANFYADDGQANGYNDGYAVTGSPNYSPSQNYLTDVGSYGSSSSFYGTFDQAGNVWEWNETFISEGRGMRGGEWNLESKYLAASFREWFPPDFETYGVGFRVATVPEPSTLGLIALGGTLFGLGAILRPQAGRNPRHKISFRRPTSPVNMEGSVVLREDTDPGSGDVGCRRATPSQTCSSASAAETPRRLRRLSDSTSRSFAWRYELACPIPGLGGNLIPWMSASRCWLASLFTRRPAPMTCMSRRSWSPC
jgi:formylglycine-generating enzyme required for sulfatase activity